jgi:divalent metal cation (Fe/Co/Zn/Cd) transporter
MLELVSKTWKENKVKFLLVAIPVAAMIVAALFFKGYRIYLMASAKKLLEKAQSKDSKLTIEATALENDAAAHKAKADELGKKADTVEDDVNWNKKK